MAAHGNVSRSPRPASCGQRHASAVRRYDLGRPGGSKTVLGISCNGGRVVGLDLSFNGMAGPIPPGYGDLVGLTSLPIPAWLGNLTNLVHLGLESSNLTGTIPTSFAKLQNLKELGLLDNPLITSTIPDGMPRLSLCTIINTGLCRVNADNPKCDVPNCKQATEDSPAKPIGIYLGSILCAAVLVFAVFMLIRWRRKKLEE
ncbi:hypothetical protein HK105_204942 [Polyrhizophydium stewartii]|uniref:Uncharacterized protein n=1 Tax=Polyrhizophydium stewartii TaxID=2732419 RepID=A0ABR4N7Q6_9FUNG